MSWSTPGSPPPLPGEAGVQGNSGSDGGGGSRPLVQYIVLGLVLAVVLGFVLVVLVQAWRYLKWHRMLQALRRSAGQHDDDDWMHAHVVDVPDLLTPAILVAHPDGQSALAWVDEEARWLYKDAAVQVYELELQPLVGWAGRGRSIAVAVTATTVDMPAPAAAPAEAEAGAVPADAEDAVAPPAAVARVAAPEGEGPRGTPAAVGLTPRRQLRHLRPPLPLSQHLTALARMNSGGGGGALGSSRGSRLGSGDLQRTISSGGSGGYGGEQGEGMQHCIIVPWLPAVPSCHCCASQQPAGGGKHGGKGGEAGRGLPGRQCSCVCQQRASPRADRPAPSRQDAAVQTLPLSRHGSLSALSPASLAENGKN